MIKFRWPSRGEALSRLDHGSGIRHRPATALSDTLASTDPVAQALWQVQRQRTLAALASIRAGLPSPRLARHDPWALRALVALTLVATFVAAGEERRARIAAAFDWNGVLAPANVRVDAWIAPPLYTNKPPIILTAQKDGAPGEAGSALAVPAGSTLIVRASGGTLDVAVTGQLTEAAPTGQVPAGTSERHFTIAGRRHRPCAIAVRPADLELCRLGRPAAEHRAGQGPGTARPRLAAIVLQAGRRLRRHRSPCALQPAGDRGRQGS